MSNTDLTRRGLLKSSILGAAAAGAAITAHDMGAKVCVMEKCDRPNGNAIYALGSVCGWGTRHQKEQGITDTADAFYAMMMDISKQMGDPALNRTYTDNISAGIDWLEKDIGVKFGKIRPMPYPRLGRTCRVVGDKSKGMTGGAALVQKLLEARGTSHERSPAGHGRQGSDPDAPALLPFTRRRSNCNGRLFRQPRPR